MNTRTALVTGASAGIGAAIAAEFAARGFNLVLVARRQDKLDELAQHVRQRHGVEVATLPLDLADPDAGTRLEAWLDERRIDVDALVNNAGYGLNGGFLDSTWQQHADMHQVMLTGYTELCHRLLPGMVRRGYGRIINVASASAVLPPVRGSMYSGIKRYVVDLAVALDYEFRDEGVQCCAVCPGFTYSEFHDVMGVREQAEGFPKIMWQSAEDVARESVDAVMAGRVFLVNGLFNRVLAGAINLLPRRLQYVMGRRSKIFED